MTAIDKHEHDFQSLYPTGKRMCIECGEPDYDPMPKEEWTRRVLKKVDDDTIPTPEQRNRLSSISREDAAKLVAEGKATYFPVPPEQRTIDDIVATLDMLSHPSAEVMSDGERLTAFCLASHLLCDAFPTFKSSIEKEAAAKRVRMIPESLYHKHRNEMLQLGKSQGREEGRTAALDEAISEIEQIPTKAMFQITGADMKQAAIEILTNLKEKV